jgi:hypothetical protein
MSSPAVGDKRAREGEEQSPKTLCEHIWRREVEGVRADLDAGVDPNAPHYNKLPIGDGVFYWQDRNTQSKDIVKLLLKAGADPTAPHDPRGGRHSPVIYDAIRLESPELMRLLLLDPETKIKVDPNTKVDFPGGPYYLPIGWVPGPYSLREFIMNTTTRPYLDAEPSEKRVRRRNEMLAIVDEAIQTRRAGVGKALNQTPLNPDVIRKIADFDTPKGRGRGRGRSTRKRRRVAKKTRKNRR